MTEAKNLITISNKAIPKFKDGKALKRPGKLPTADREKLHTYKAIQNHSTSVQATRLFWHRRTQKNNKIKLPLG